ncbi:aspartate aminotransferase, cytoplasmic [Candida albicans P76067]|nr:aspartate aminotransferase, cytoplasmic [Candida albicans GC75]KGU00994.1 aspartate aminotransferase, cytoplasmic [Candida albicans P87]KGU21630.1 aspartate aminotransferase, cytoplasmic [Candida albicans P75063]KHC28561.1 aspartate aminotransferase, cytoplasmic [Candida albicans P76067]KHC28767.1 aspartate aminotransferase, cytoplasmic [Candida albicans Ca6]KHC59980.1 aspartate aminotransferase, cytoplasmic [Candida albicans P75016]
MAPFAGIKELPPDPLFGLKARYNADSRTNKVDLGIGAYRDNNGKPWILPAVRQAEQKLINSPDYNHEYLSISGYAPFTESAAKVILGENSLAIKDKKIVSQQSLSGTGALHLAGVFIKEFYQGNHTIYLSQPTWANHKQIFEYIGFKVASYPYWNNDTKSLDLSGFLKAISSAPDGSVFLLHACAHNPTGLDPNQSQWDEILAALEKKKHFIIFDSAYQGFASGDLEKDAYPIRKAIDSKVITSPIIICQSFAKNVGMYGERVGAIHVIPSTVESNDSLNRAIKSQLNRIIRSELSNPPAYGSKIVATILNDPELYSQWRKDLVTMSSRIGEMRNTLRSKLESLGTPGTWNHITEQTGMFSFTGLTPQMVERLEKHHGIYLVSSGRASVAGLNEHNVDQVAKAIDEVVRHFGKSKL